MSACMKSITRSCVCARAALWEMTSRSKLDAAGHDNDPQQKSSAGTGQKEAVLEVMMRVAFPVSTGVVGVLVVAERAVAHVGLGRAGRYSQMTVQDNRRRQILPSSA